MVNKKSQSVIVKIGARQFILKKGDELLVDKISESKIKDGKVVYDSILGLFDNEKDITLGNPKIKGNVSAKVIEKLVLGKKIIVQKYKPKIRYQRRQGHRQQYSRIKIEDISVV